MIEIKETELRELYREEMGIPYNKIGMKYKLWRRDKIKSLIEEHGPVTHINIIRDDPESYIDKR